MQTYRIGAVWRAGREDTGQWPFEVAAWMHLDDVTLSEVQPGQQDEFVARPDALKPLRGVG